MEALVLLIAMPVQCLGMIMKCQVIKHQHNVGAAAVLSA